MNSHSSSLSSNQEEIPIHSKFDISQHNIIFSDTLSRLSKGSNSSSASKLATLSDKINSCLAIGADNELAAFRRSHTELKELANYCQNGEIGFNEIKTFSAQSLASVAYRINSASKLVLEVLSSQSKQFNELEHELNLTNQRVLQFQEKRGRHKIAEYTTDKSSLYMRRITPPSTKERPEAYIRTPIDYTKYDGVGRGFFYADYKEDVSRYARQNVPLSLSCTSEDFQIVPRIANDSPTLPPAINPNKLTNGSADQYSIPVTTFHPNRYVARSKHLRPREHAIPVFYPSHNASNSTLNRYDSPDILCQGHTADSLYDYIQPISRHTPNNWDKSSETTSVTSLGKDSFKPDECSLPDLSQLPAPPEYLLTSSPLDDSNISTYEMMLSQQQQQQQQTQQEERESPKLVQVNNSIPTAPISYIEKVLTVYKYASQRYDELSFEPGNIIYVVKKNDDGWYEGVLNGYRGLFPGNYAEVV